MPNSRGRTSAKTAAAWSRSMRAKPLSPHRSRLVASLLAASRGRDEAAPWSVTGRSCDARPAPSLSRSTGPSCPDGEPSGTRCDVERILIVGGGYAGFYTAWGLEKRLRHGEAELTVVDPRPYMTYQPFLPEVLA